jgi:hypothetical protein
MLHTCLRVRGQQDQHDTRKSSFEQLAMMSAPILQRKTAVWGEYSIHQRWISLVLSS